MLLWWIFHLSQKFCRAVRDWFPACCHPPVSHFDTQAANIPQFISIFSDYVGLAALALLLFRHLFIDSLTHADRQILTWETSQVSCEWIWMESSICPSAIRPHWKPNADSTQREAEENLKMSSMWLRLSQGKSSQPRRIVSVAFILLVKLSREVWNFKC